MKVLENTQLKKIEDKYLRHIHKLRVQLTDACNFRCFYCMPENIKFKKKSELLTKDQIISISSELVNLGIDEIRVTGGEPTIRQEFKEIVSGLSKLKLKKLGLTTNAFNLTEHLDFLKTTNCHYINISLDSLNPHKFGEITKTNYFPQVIKSILKSKELNFETKINVVVSRGINDDEILDFINFSADNNIEVRFLELMKIGPAYEMNPHLFISANEMISKIKTIHQLKKIKVSKDSTSFNYSTESGAKIGFIASESQPFCNTCSRLRLSATGMLRACLMSEDGINLKDVDKSQYSQIIKNVIAMKPIERIDYIKQSMNQIGG